jgi:hypothetical protein
MDSIQYVTKIPRLAGTLHIIDVSECMLLALSQRLALDSIDLDISTL